MRLLWVALPLLVLARCSNDPGTCNPPATDLPAGTYANSHGAWILGATNHTLEIDHERHVAIVEFDKGGVRYRVTYRTREYEHWRVPALYISITGQGRDSTDCDRAMEGGPVIDAVTLYRDGKAIGPAQSAELALPYGTRCSMTKSVDDVVGAPDDIGFPLGNESLSPIFERYARPQSGDEIEVRATGGYFSVWLGGAPPAGEEASGIKIGGGSGDVRLTVP